MHHVVVHFLLTLEGLQLTSFADVTFRVQNLLLKFKDNLEIILYNCGVRLVSVLS